MTKDRVNHPWVEEEECHQEEAEEKITLKTTQELTEAVKEVVAEVVLQDKMVHHPIVEA